MGGWSYASQYHGSRTRSRLFSKLSFPPHIANFDWLECQRVLGCIKMSTYFRNPYLSILICTSARSHRHSPPPCTARTPFIKTHHHRRPLQMPIQWSRRHLRRLSRSRHPISMPAATATATATAAAAASSLHHRSLHRSTLSSRTLSRLRIRRSSFSAASNTWPCARFAISSRSRACSRR